MNKIVSIIFFGYVGFMIWISIVMKLIKILYYYLFLLVNDVDIGLVVIKNILIVKLFNMKC